MTAKKMPIIKLEPHGQQLRFRKRIPKDVSEYFAGPFLYFNTKTKDPTAARAECLRWLADVEEQFEQYRRAPTKLRGVLDAHLKGKAEDERLSDDAHEAIYAAASTQFLHSLSPDQREAIKAAVQRSLLAADDALRMDAMNAEVMRCVVEDRKDTKAGEVGSLCVPFPADDGDGLNDAQADFLEERNAALRDQFVKALARQNRNSVKAAATRAALEVGLRIDWNSPDGQTLLGELLPLFATAARAVASRDQGDVVETPSAPKGQPVRPLHRISEALPIWEAYKKPAISTVEIYANAAALFASYFPGLYVETITKADIKAFVSKRMEEGKKASTIEKEHGALRALLGFAVEEGWRDDNPASNVKLPSDKGAKPRRSYTPEELSQVFQTEVFTTGARPRMGKGEAAFWLPLLALFTGARREELAQLETDRIRSEEGVPYLAIDPIDDSGRLKTDESSRAVPIHHELIRIGFLDFVEQAKASGTLQLFPELKPNKRGQYAAKWGDWWGPYVRKKAGVADDRIGPMHSFRHTFITELRRLRVREDVERALAGHTTKTAKRDAHDGYGEHLVPALAEDVNRMTFRDLDLSHVVWRHAAQVHTDSQAGKG